MAAPLHIMEDDGEEPPLSLAILSQWPDANILSLIQNTHDVNVSNDRGDTPLHWAVRRESMAVPLELIRRGADINAQGTDGATPLHYAVYHCNIEAVSLLLYYNVDVTIACSDNKVAFMDAVECNRLEIAYLLLNYHDEFPVSTPHNYSALNIFAHDRNPIAIDLVYKGVNVNITNTNGYSAITQSINYDSPDLFKLLWPQIDKSILFLTKMPFLLLYIDNCNFNSDDWVECLYFVLEDDVAFDLVDHCMNSLIHLQHQSFIRELLPSIDIIDMDLNHRTKIIYTFLSLGAEVYFSDIDWLVGKDSTEDVLFLRYFATNDKYMKPYKHVLSEFITVTCRPRSYTQHYISELFLTQATECDFCDCLMNSFERALEYFSLPLRKKPELVEMVRGSNKRRIDSATRKINITPEFPTLIELCRNRIRTRIQESCNIRQPYQFYDAVEKLPLPDKVKNLISFKSSLWC